MTNSVEALAFEQLERILSDKHAEFEKAFDEGQAVPELNNIYKQIKALQIEINLRRLASA